jgi:hypothetical protein
MNEIMLDKGSILHYISPVFETTKLKEDVS